MIEIVGGIAMLLSISGVLLNNRRRRECFVLWLVSNAACCFIHAQTGVWTLAARDAVFFLLAIEGFIRWGKAKVAK